ncbi:MAG: hypothetical protein GY830_04450 [Bacteroidetes bacterium]|nr:hypothetical protein [Bacteroidota bacterium]
MQLINTVLRKTKDRKDIISEKEKLKYSKNFDSYLRKDIYFFHLKINK